MHFIISTAFKAIIVLASASSIAAAPTNNTAPSSTNVAVHNDFHCKSKQHPNPVVLLHGMGGNYTNGLEKLELFLQQQNYCTYSLTYGAHPDKPEAGGVVPVDISAIQIASFIEEVKLRTGADKIDLVGHSEGAFMSLYVPKTTGVSHLIDNIVATAPPTHGTDLDGKFSKAFFWGQFSRDIVGLILDLKGCPVCNELGVGGPGVRRLDRGNIVQPGNTVTILQSLTDGVVTPTNTSFVYEAGVTNYYVQDFCPDDKVTHLQEAYDKNMWNLLINALEKKNGRSFACDSAFN